MYNVHVYIYFHTPKESNNRMAPEIKCTCFVVEKDEVKEGIRSEGKGREGLFCALGCHKFGGIHVKQIKCFSYVALL